MENKDGVFITGAARSGTSLVAGIVDLCGAFGGVTSPPNAYNQKGMFENTAIRNNVVKSFLRKMRCDEKGQFPLPTIPGMPVYAGFDSLLRDQLKKEGYTTGKWYYKGAKICLMWPYYKHYFSTSKFIIVRRADDDIVNSCIRTGFMNAFSNRTKQQAVGAKNETQGWHWWVKQHHKRFQEMKAAGLQVREIWPSRMMTGDYAEVREVVEWAGLEFNELKVKQFIDPKLYKARKKQGIL